MLLSLIRGAPGHPIGFCLADTRTHRQSRTRVVWSDGDVHSVVASGEQAWAPDRICGDGAAHRSIHRALGTITDVTPLGL